MGILHDAADNAAASTAKAAVSVSSAAYSFTQLPLSTIAAAISIVVSLVYLWGALPRWYRTTTAFCRGLFRGDWSDWRKLGDQPMQGDE
jgi:hypothetical protein